MTKDKYMMLKGVLNSLRWSCEHLFLPGFIVIVGLYINNYYQDKRSPSLSVLTGPHQVSELSDEKYLIECSFRIGNDGGSSTKNRRVFFYLQGGFRINQIKIDPKYRGFIDQQKGGVGKNFVILSVTLPRNKLIYGIIAFYSNVKIPKESLGPLIVEY